MKRSSLIFIAKLRDNSIVWSSPKLDIIKDQSVQIYAWHHFWNFLKSLSSDQRDPVGFYVKVQTFNEDLSGVEEVRHYCARKIQSLSNETYNALDSSVGYEILPWDDEYIPQIIEQELEPDEKNV